MPWRVDSCATLTWDHPGIYPQQQRSPPTQATGALSLSSCRNKLDCIGTIAYIKEVVEMTKSGESTIVIQGLRRFKFKKGGSLRMQPGSFGLNFADIEFFDDQRDEGEEDSDSSSTNT